MANNNETTTKFKVDISELKKAMQDAKRQVAVANSEFKAVSSTMDDWSKSSDGLGAKLTQLKSNLDAQKTVLSSLERQYELTVKEMGEGSKAADDLKIKINNQKAVVNQTEREIGKYEDALSEVVEAEKVAAKTGKSVAEVLEDVGDEAEDAGDGFTVLKGAVATFTGNILTSLASGIKDAASNLLGLAESTREYREQMNKLESASNDAGYSVDYAKEKYKELYGVLGDETAANTTISNLMAMGLEQGQLNGLINSATGIWAKYGDSIPLDGLAESINETAKVGQITGNLADALNWAGVSEDEFNESLAECTNEQARQKLILAVLNKNYGELGENYKTSNKDVIEAREAQADYTDTLAELGEKVEPVTTSLQKGFNGLLQELIKLVGDVDMEAFTASIEEGFKVVTDEVLPAVKEGLGWILDNKDMLIAGLTGLATAFGAFKVVSTINGILQAFNITLLANPVVLIVTAIVAAIAALVAAFMYLWNNSEEFRQFWINLWEKIKEFCSKAIDGIVHFFTVTIPEAIANMVTFLSELPQKFWTWLLATITKVIEWRRSMIEKAIELGKSFLQSIVTFFSELPYKIGYLLGQAIGYVIQWGINLYNFATTEIPAFIARIIEFIKELPQKFWTWLLATINKVIQWRQDMITKAKEIALGFLNKMIEFIKQLPEKMWNWFVNVITKVTEWRKNMIEKAKEVASGFLEKIMEFIKQLPSKAWEQFTAVITKISEWATKLAEAGASAATSLFNSIINKVKELPETIKEYGSEIVKGLWNGISNMSEWLAEKLKSFGDGVLSGIKDFFGIASPSKLMAAEVGRWLPEGIAVGIDKNAKSAISAMKDMAVNTVGAARNGLSSANATLGVSGVASGGVVNNFTQNNYSPKALSRLDIYRQSKNLLGYAGGAR